MKELAASDAFIAIKSWAAAAAKGETQSECPEVSPLCFTLAKDSTIRRVESKLHSYNGIGLIEFDIDGPKSEGVKTRYMLPVHFAITRLLELIPGVRVRMRGDAHETPGDDRPAGELIYSLEVRFSASFKKSYELRESRLERILFNAPPDVRLHERRTGSYRYIIPSSFVPIRTRRLDAQNADTWLRVVAKAVRQGGADELLDAPEVLRQLFVTAERWHWAELIDRLEDDPRVSSR